MHNDLSLLQAIPLSILKILISVVLYITRYLPWLSHFHVTLKKEKLSTKHAAFELISSNINSRFLYNKIDAFATQCKEIRNILGFQGFDALDSGCARFRILDRQWNRDSGFQSIFLEVYWPDFKTKISRVPDSTSKIFRDSGIRNLLHQGTNLGVKGSVTLSITPRTAKPSEWDSDSEMFGYLVL